MELPGGPRIGKAAPAEVDGHPVGQKGQGYGHQDEVGREGRDQGFAHWFSTFDTMPAPLKSNYTSQSNYKADSSIAERAHSHQKRATKSGQNDERRQADSDTDYHQLGSGAGAGIVQEAAFSLGR